MNTSDFIQLIAIITSIVLSVIAIKQSNKSIKLTELSIEEENRPYLSLYYEDIQATSTIITYVVLKNFGKSGAYIDSITCTPSMDNNKHLRVENNPFESLKDYFIAPSQSFPAGLYIQGNNTKDMVTSRSYTINYHYQYKKYSETFTFNECATNKINFFKTAPKENDTTAAILLRASQELFRKNL